MPAVTTIAGSDEFCAVVTAGPDPDADNDEATVTLQAAGGGYDGSPAEEAVVTVQDLGSSPPRGVYVSALNLAIQEGDTPTYVVALTSQPTGDVTIEITAFNDDGSDGQNNVNTVPRSLWSETRELAFTTENWHVAQTVTVNSDEDPDRDDHTATIRHQVSGADYGENDVTAPSIRVSVEDVAWVYYYIEAPSVVDENAGSYIATVRSLFKSPFPPKRPHIFQLQTIEPYFTAYLSKNRPWIPIAYPSAICSLGGDFQFRNLAHHFVPGDYHSVSPRLATPVHGINPGQHTDQCQAPERPLPNLENQGRDLLVRPETPQGPRPVRNGVPAVRKRQNANKGVCTPVRRTHLPVLRQIRGETRSRPHSPPEQRGRLPGRELGNCL